LGDIVARVRFPALLLVLLAASVSKLSATPSAANACGDDLSALSAAEGERAMALIATLSDAPTIAPLFSCRNPRDPSYVLVSTETGNSRGGLYKIFLSQTPERIQQLSRGNYYPPTAIIFDKTGVPYLVLRGSSLHQGIWDQWYSLLNIDTGKEQVLFLGNQDPSIGGCYEGLDLAANPQPFRLEQRDGGSEDLTFDVQFTDCHSKATATHRFRVTPAEQGFEKSEIVLQQ
jgi:hypothetical protein